MFGDAAVVRTWTHFAEVYEKIIYLYMESNEIWVYIVGIVHELNVKIILHIGKIMM